MATTRAMRGIKRTAGLCTITTNNDDKLKLYEAVPILKRYIKDPFEPNYVVIRMKPQRIRLMAQAGKGHKDIEMPQQYQMSQSI